MTEKSITVSGAKPKVYLTSNLSGDGLLAAYRALGVTVSGKVALKIHMGEPGNTNYLRPELLAPLAADVHGVCVDSNVYYGGPRGAADTHRQVARDHGFTFAPVDILDADGDANISVSGGKWFAEAILGAHILDYDWIISVAHFKGHVMAGFGGTFKNLAIGIASPRGKAAIHSRPGGGRWDTTGAEFLEKVVEYNKALYDKFSGRILCVNVLNNLSVDCDCDSHAHPPAMPDIGILASADPVALEQASLDQIYARPAAERQALVERIENADGQRQITYAEELGLGRRDYELVNLDRR